MKLAAALPLALALLAPAAPAQEAAPLDGPHRTFQDPLLDQLAGEWSMAGTVRSRPVAYRLRAEWVLGHQFLRLEMRDAAEPPAYQAVVFVGYDHASERYVAHWLDAFGGRASETLGFGQRSGSSIRLVFEYPDGPFHTSFALDAANGTWSILMRNRGKGGAWQDFARYTAVRKAPEP
jgi:hypothetical protein